MMLLGLGIVLITLLLVMKTRKGRAALHTGELVQEDGMAFIAGASLEDEEESEVLAVITAAIAEFEGDSNFQVASIKRRSQNWKLTGCQELVGSRLN